MSLLGKILEKDPKYNAFCQTLDHIEKEESANMMQIFEETLRKDADFNTQRKKLIQCSENRKRRIHDAYNFYYPQH